MDHDLAIKNNAAERYLLGELTAVEIEEYEEHFFSCTACAQEVKLGSEFIDHAREVFKTDFIPATNPAAKMSTAWGRFWNSMRQPAPAFAFAALILVSGLSVYQTDVIRALKEQATAPRLLATASPMLRESRGTAQEPAAVPRDQSFAIAFDIPPGDFSSYEIEVSNAQKTRKFLFHCSAQQAKNTIQIAFPAGSLQTGTYALVIRGVNSGTGENQVNQEVKQYSFEVQIL
jgi:hypothetical protein